MIARALSLAGRVSPAGWIIGLVILVGAFGAAGMMTPRIGPFTFDPFNRQAVRLKDANAKADQEASNGAARGLEVEGEREQAQRVEAAADRATRAALSAATAIAEARSAPDANDHLPSDRADRLNRVDDGLCVVSPALAGCAPSPVDSGAGDDAL